MRCLEAVDMQYFFDHVSKSCFVIVLGIYSILCTFLYSALLLVSLPVSDVKPPMASVTNFLNSA